MSVKPEDLLRGCEFGAIDLEAGESIIEAFVIVRTFKADRDAIGTAFTSTVGLHDDPLRLGILQLVSDQIRECARRGWDENPDG